MAEFRKVKCDMWRGDEWFQELPTDARLLWVYLFTNASTSVAGIYKIPLKTIAFESGLSTERVQELLAQFAQAGKSYYEQGVLWVCNMRAHQAGETPGPTVLTCIDRDLAKIPYGHLKQRYLVHYGYSTNTLPGDRDRDRDQTETKTKTKTKKGAVAPPPAEEMTEPAVVIYRDLTHLTPKPIQRKLIVDGVGDLERWRSTVKDWLEHDWNPKNIPGMLERYAHGNGTGKPDPRKMTHEELVAKYIPEGYEDLIEH
jgi:hypothetical protein